MMREYTKYLMWVYLVCVLLAEWLIGYVNVVYGLLIHSSVFIASILIYWKNWSKFTIEGSLVILAFSYISLSRLVSVSIIEEVNETILIMAFANTPLLVGLLECLRSIDIPVMKFISPAKNHLKREVLIGLTGIIFGLTETRLLTIQAVPWDSMWSYAINALTIVILTGFYEELLFRAIILKYLADIGSKWFALIYSSLLFAIMHIAWHSFMDLAFVFTVGLIYGFIFLRTRNIVGISISHGITNIILFLR